MKDLLVYLEKNRNEFNLPERSEITIELYAPWRSSRTGRCMYKVRTKNVPKPNIVIQDSLTLYGIQCEQNPYEPEFLQIVDRFLPAHRGSFIVNGSVYFWADYIDGHSLRNIILHDDKKNDDIWPVVFQLAGEIGKLQETNSFESSDFFSELAEKTLYRIGDGNLGNLFMQSIEKVEKHGMLCSWSHGDLWLQDVLMCNTTLCILDWEWAVNAAPIGCDLIDLYVTSAEHILNIPTEQAWRGFLSNQIQQLQGLRQKIHTLWSRVDFDKYCRKGVVAYSLIRSIGRVIAQDASESTSLIKCYLKLSSELLNDRLSFVYSDEDSHADLNVSGAPCATPGDKQMPGIKKFTIDQLLPNDDVTPTMHGLQKVEDREIQDQDLEVICRIVQNEQPRNVFEFGFFRGKTTLCLAANSTTQIYKLDLPPKSRENSASPAMNDLELGVYTQNPSVKFRDTSDSTRIYQLYGDSQSFDFSPYFGTMDIVFVDSCQQHEFALRDNMNAFKMIRPEGIIIWQDHVEYAPGVMSALKMVSQRFPLFHISGTSLVIFIGERNRTFQDHGQEATGNMAPPDATATGSQTGGESPVTLPAGLKIILEDKPRDTATAKFALLERIAQSPGDVDALVDLALIEVAGAKSKDALVFLEDALILDSAHERALSLKASIETGHKPIEKPDCLSGIAIPPDRCGPA